MQINGLTTFIETRVPKATITLEAEEIRLLTCLFENELKENSPQNPIMLDLISEFFQLHSILCTGIVGDTSLDKINIIKNKIAYLKNMYKGIEK